MQPKLLDLPSETEQTSVVDIGGLIYTIDTMPDHLKPQLLGSIVEKELKIYLNPEMAEGYRRLVLMHEITHGFGFAIDMDVKESQVERLSRVILNFLKDNHELVAYLAEMEVVE